MRCVLGPARRDLPRALVWRLLFGAPVVAFGWLFAALGMVFVLIFLPMLDLGASYDRHGTATITNIEETTSSEGEQTIYRVRYRFLDAAGSERHGESFTTSPPTAPGAWSVEYRDDDPSTSRLDGMRRRPFSALVLIVLVFPIAGLGLVIWQLRTARRDLHLLRHGVETRGKLLARRETSFRVNDAPIIALTFQYDADGARHTTTVKTLVPGPLEDDEHEAMLYDPRAPHRATTLDHLPGSPRITATGELEARPGMVFHLLIAPIAFAALLAATLIRML